MNINCPHPNCNKNEFTNERSMKIHHTMAHGESIAKDTTTCENCGGSFEYYPSSKNGIYCNKCVEEGCHRSATVHQIICSECDEEFNSKRKDQSFCSRQCYIENITTKKVSCSECNKKTTNYPKNNPLCKICRQRVARRKRRKILIKYKGGVCEECGYENIVTLNFHHRKEEQKRFQLSGNEILRSMDDVIEEVEKCDLLCRNCHREKHCTGSVFCDHQHS